MAVFNRDPLSTTTWSRLRRGLNEDMDMVMESARRNNVLPRVTFVPWGSAKKKTHPSHLPNPQRKSPPRSPISPPKPPRRPLLPPSQVGSLFCPAGSRLYFAALVVCGLFPQAPLVFPFILVQKTAISQPWTGGTRDMGACATWNMDMGDMGRRERIWEKTVRGQKTVCADITIFSGIAVPPALSPAAGPKWPSVESSTTVRSTLLPLGGTPPTREFIHPRNS